MAEPARRGGRQRAAVSEFLADQDRFVSAQEVYAHLRERGNAIGLATVYRALQTMIDDGELDVLHGDDGESTYRRCGSDQHHHHLVCRRCGRTVEVADRAVERWADRVAERHGFTEVEHRVEVFGVCAACARVPTASRPRASGRR